MWGCFRLVRLSVLLVIVFPMHVGVFLVCLILLRCTLCLPHACGGVSLSIMQAVLCDLSSPCMWGCFYCLISIPSIAAVFPMHVGVFLVLPIDKLLIIGLPHACGGVSKLGDIKMKYGLSSPCMWGCFLMRWVVASGPMVFPMHVGVFLRFENLDVTSTSLPHACGGVSQLRQAFQIQRLSSPCMWGCFSKSPIVIINYVVFPMHVGLFLNQIDGDGKSVGLPHACGGVSTTSLRDFRH